MLIWAVQAKFAVSLGKACVELACFIDVKPADLLLNDGMEELLSQSLHLPSSCQCPESHLNVCSYQNYTSHDAVVYGMPVKEKSRLADMIK